MIFCNYADKINVGASNDLKLPYFWKILPNSQGGENMSQERGV